MHLLYIEDDSRDIDLARLALARSGLAIEFVAVGDEAQALDYLFC